MTQIYVIVGLGILLFTFSIGYLAHLAGINRRYLVPGIDLYNAGPYDAAVPYLVKAVKYAPSDNGFYYLGLCREKKGQYQIARRDFEVAINMASGGKNPDDLMVTKCQREVDAIDKAQ